MESSMKEALDDIITKKLHYCYVNIKARCNISSTRDYKSYGGRGIKVEWKSYNEFDSDMRDWCLPCFEIDRIDNDWNYSKENCRWTTHRTNCNNRCNTLKIDDVPLTEYCKTKNLNPKAIRTRMSRGMSLEEALTKPIKSRKCTTRTPHIIDNMLLAHYCKKHSLAYATIINRINRQGLSVKKAVSISMKEKTLEINGTPLRKYCKENNISYTTIYNCYKKGISLEEAISMPIKAKKRNKKKQYKN